MMRALAVAAALCVSACDDNTPTYFPSPTGPIEVGAMGQPSQARTKITLPFRAPSEEEQGDLGSLSSAAGHRVPFLRRDEVAISVQYTITNLSDRLGRAQLFIDGASELARYDAVAMRATLAMQPGADDDIIVLSLFTGTPVLVEPGRSLSGTVREDELGEAALDLDAIGRWMAVPASVLINASQANPVGLEGRPADAVVPAFYDLDITFTASTHMRLELLVRVRDHRSRLRPGETDVFTPQPVTVMANSMR